MYSYNRSENMTLVIMAAGMGSRYGGLKQIDAVGPNGEFIIDYSVYDAIKAGFDKVVFIIKRENEEIFKETIGKRVEKYIDVKYAFQDLDNIPEGIEVPSDRVKPWGTTHAILACKDIVKENFAIINADDFYGFDAYKTVSEFLNNLDSNSFNIGLVGYRVENTLTENGSVKRGICEVEDKYLTKLIESQVSRENGIINAKPLDGSQSFVISNNQLVSMNMLGFTPKIFDLLEEDFKEYLNENRENLSKCERLIPDTVYKYIKQNKVKVEVLDTTSTWYGVTYKEDRPMIISSINKLLDDEVYPRDLWNK